jgi:hypothetical protein
MQLPIIVSDYIKAYEKESNVVVNESLAKLFEIAVVLINTCYAYAKSNCNETCPLDKQECIQLASSMYLKNGEDFTDMHKEFFEEAIDTAIEAYQQGLIEGRQKARAC